MTSDEKGMESPSAVTEPAPESYWEEPPEKQLEGKTLSTMDMTMLEKEHLPLENEKPAGEGTVYWDWKENIRKSLSKLTLSELLFQRGQKQPTDESPGEDTTDKMDNDGEPSTSDTQNSSEVVAPPGPYWFWRNASLTNLRLSTASLTSLENAARSSDAKAVTTSVDQPPPGGYWFWRNPSMKNMSNVSLDTMEKTAREADRMESKEVVAGPISNMQHKLRSSWRKSFQHLSSNSLTKLDEADGENRGQNWKDAFAFGKKSNRESFSVHEEEDAGAITF